MRKSINKQLIYIKLFDKIFFKNLRKHIENKDYEKV